MIKHLVIITQEYPTPTHPIYPFVDQFACAVCDLGVRVTVIAPLSLTNRLLKGLEMPPVAAVRRTLSGRDIDVYRPRYASVSDSVLGLNTAMLSYRGFKRAALLEMRRRGLKPDAIYGHFIAMGGLCASELGEMLRIPAFLAYGESSPKRYEAFDPAFIRARLQTLAGIISVSSENKRRLIETGLVDDPARIEVFPNAVDLSHFHPGDKKAERRALHFPEDAFIAVFVGSFIERKGLPELLTALKRLTGVHAVFIGRGDIDPDCPNILFRGAVPADQVANYLRAGDIFTLPSHNEGLSNAIVEALACGLPVVSSDRPFNDDVLTEENSLRIEPTDVASIAQAIERLRDDRALRERLSAGALETAKGLDIRERARRIIDYMEAP